MKAVGNERGEGNDLRVVITFLFLETYARDSYIDIGTITIRAEMLTDPKPRRRKKA